MLKCYQEVRIANSVQGPKNRKERTLFFSHWAFSGQSLAIWSWPLQMKQPSPGINPGTLSGCLLRVFLVGLLGPSGSDFLRLNLSSFFFFFFLVGSLGGVGSSSGKSSGCASLNRLRASLCLWLTISRSSALAWVGFRLGGSRGGAVSSRRIF